MHKIRLTARGNELDSYNHVNNAVYLNYLEQARWELFRDADLLAFLYEMELMVVVTEIKIKFIREVKIFEELEIHTRVSRRDPFLVFTQHIHNATTGLSAARAETRTLFITRTRTPVDIPPEVINRFKL